MATVYVVRVQSRPGDSPWVLKSGSDKQEVLDFVADEAEGEVIESKGEVVLGYQFLTAHRTLWDTSDGVVWVEVYVDGRREGYL